MLLTTKRSRTRLAGVGLASIAALILVGCAATPGGSTGTAAGDCGTAPGAAPTDPDGVVAKLPKKTQEGYVDFTPEVVKSAWADYTGSDEPLQLGASLPPIYNAYTSNIVTLISSKNAALAADGVTTKDVTVAILPDPATMSPAEQLKQYQQLVADGVDGIILVPLSGEAMADAVTAAGKAGIPTVSASSTYIPSPYALNVMINQGQAITNTTGPILKQIGGKGSVLVVHGIPGESSDVLGSATLKAMLKKCPDVKVIGEVTGNYSNAAAKAAVQQFLASHPQKIDMVWQTAAMGPGIIGAFEQAGRDVPPIGLTGLQAGDASWWKDHADSYSTAGSTQTSDQTLGLAYDVLIRTLQGEGPLVNTFVFTPQIVTNDNVADFAVKGADLNSPDEVKAGPDAVATSAELDAFFARPAK